MRDQLTALARLAEIDASARELEQELAAIPARLDDLRADAQRLEALLGRERDQIRDAERVRQSIDEEIARANDLLGRSKAKAAKAKNAREAEAVERELDTARRTIRDRDAEKAELAVKVEQVRASLATHEGEFESFKASLREQEEKAAVRIAELTAERDKAVQGRDDVARRLPAPLVRKYDAIRVKRGSGVSEVKDGACSACRLSLPHQQYQVLLRGETVEQCPNCNRLLFHRSLVLD